MLILSMEMKGRNSVLIRTEEGIAFRLPAKSVLACGLRENEEISEDTEKEIFNELRTIALQKSAKLLGDMDYTESGLRAKLSENGIPGLIIDEVIESLINAHYLDDLRFCESYIRYHLQDRSVRRIGSDLLKRGASQDVIDRAMQSVTDDGCSDPDKAEEEQIRDYLIRKKYSASSFSSAEKQKIAAALYRKGYSSENIRRVMGAFIDCEVTE